MDSLPKETRKILAITLWCIWKRRNERVWEGKNIPIAISTTTSLQFQHEWSTIRAHSASNSQHALHQQNIDLTWKKPPPRSIKINVDAAIFNDEGSYGVRMVLRDDNGNFMHAKILTTKGTPGANEAKV